MLWTYEYMYSRAESLIAVPSQLVAMSAMEVVFAYASRVSPSSTFKLDELRRHGWVAPIERLDRTSIGLIVGQPDGIRRFAISTQWSS